ncbi:MAG: transposase [Candidatus Sungbacteria bacterium]|nr:transposase [Candidatus Sungbacteria bacterium]
MPKRKEHFSDGEIYHICNRGVDKRLLFLDDQDYFRFIHNLYEFNDEKPATLFYYKQSALKSYEIRSHSEPTRKPVVDLLTFTLMPNHYHLLLTQKKDNGITDFMRKLGVGYAMYFNQKYNRSGTLFQGAFKAIRVIKESHFLHLPFYIHANPLDLKFPEWREQKIRNYKAAMKFLENYRWSSFPDYIGKMNFPSVTNKEFLLNFFGSTNSYKHNTIDLLREMHLTAVNEVSLEPIDKIL